MSQCGNWGSFLQIEFAGADSPSPRYELLDVGEAVNKHMRWRRHQLTSNMTNWSDSDDYYLLSSCITYIIHIYKLQSNSKALAAISTTRHVFLMSLEVPDSFVECDYGRYWRVWKLSQIITVPESFVYFQSHIMGWLWKSENDSGIKKIFGAFGATVPESVPKLWPGMTKPGTLTKNNISSFCARLIAHSVEIDLQFVWCGYLD